MTDYKSPSGPPPNWQNQQSGSNADFYNETPTTRGVPQGNYYQQQPQQGYYQQGPPQGGYYQQQQPMYYQQQQQPVYVQQQQPAQGNNADCLTACLAGMCLCCTLDAIF
ncbi:unnamed protein product [Kuraishia capsulata CBS 1993]|uniref:Cysteine-rich transmembrane domain-containing protein n=1 Tax=Kuraishia capsulata CBS 1993 TaxID=1382522 RepID=W6MFM6_9ASCO|nr:uncharacterized protein KUCA_T00000378001 [Kuraishia capsulata CBS 1993]CDK24416.1 unnamed protein product [Kuraishia capsulata CBS 1993]